MRSPWVLSPDPRYSTTNVAGPEIYYDHAYVVDKANLDATGNVTSVVLINPNEGPLSQFRRVTVSIADLLPLASWVTEYTP